jgi:hypothetical protein
VRAPGRLPQTERNPAADEEPPAGVTFRLAVDPDAGTLVVSVRDDLGGPVSPFTVQGFGPDFGSWTETGASATGELRVEGLVAGKHAGYVTAPGHSIGGLSADVPKGGEVRLDVRLARTGAVALRILDAKGNVATHVAVSVADERGKGPAWRWVYARPQGTAFVMKEWTVFAGDAPTGSHLSEAEGRIEGLPAGTYVLRVGEGATPREVSMQVRAAGETKLEVRLDGG